MDRSCHVLWVRVMKFVCFVSPSVSIFVQELTINGKMGNLILGAMNLDSSKCINLANNFPFHCIIYLVKAHKWFFWCKSLKNRSVLWDHKKLKIQFHFNHPIIRPFLPWASSSLHANNVFMWMNDACHTSSDKFETILHSNYVWMWQYS